jgi:hypothetical protein
MHLKWEEDTGSWMERLALTVGYSGSLGEKVKRT